MPPVGLLQADPAAVLVVQLGEILEVHGGLSDEGSLLEVLEVAELMTVDELLDLLQKRLAGNACDATSRISAEVERAERSAEVYSP